MVFSSLEFLLMFLTITLLVYFIVPLKIRNIVLLIVSLIFYGWGEPVYVFLMIFTIAVDYIFGLLVERNLKKDDRKRAKTCLVLSIVINLSILGFFKYYDFFVSTSDSSPVSPVCRSSDSASRSASPSTPSRRSHTSSTSTAATPAHSTMPPPSEPTSPSTRSSSPVL